MSDPLKPPRAEDWSSGPVSLAVATDMRRAMLEWIVANQQACIDYHPSGDCYEYGHGDDEACVYCVARKELER